MFDYLGHHWADTTSALVPPVRPLDCQSSPDGLFESKPSSSDGKFSAIRAISLASCDMAVSPYVGFRLCQSEIGTSNILGPIHYLSTIIHLD